MNSGGAARVTVVDAGIGNVSSVVNMLDHIGIEWTLGLAAEQLAQASALILPGVGAFDAGIRELEKRGFPAAIRAAVESGASVLGICLGAQLLLEGSDEGDLPGLGLIPGRARALRDCLSADRLTLPVPHMGWNRVRPRVGAQLFAVPESEWRFYFAHSYLLEPSESEDVAATCSYGVTFACAVERARVMGVQFHPEKSHRFGMALLARFAALTC